MAPAPHTVKYDFGGEIPALPAGSLVLVTGVTGLIGGHIADKLLAAGYKVRGVSRSAKRGQWTVDYFTQAYGKDRYELAEVADMSSGSGFTEALKGVAGVIHTASDLSFSDDYEKVVPPTVEHIRAILDAASKQDDVKRFVYTSSSTALTEPDPGNPKKITVDTWNEESEELAKSGKARRLGFSVYAASKSLGEKAAWEFYREKKPSYVLNCVLPNMNYGRTLTKDHGGSTSLIADVIWDEKEVNDNRPGADPQWWVDAEDTALLHVAALIDARVREERIMAFAGPFNWTTVLETWKKVAPERDWGKGDKNEKTDEMSIPTERAKELLSHFEVDSAKKNGFISMEDSLKKKLASDREQGKK